MPLYRIRIDRIETVPDTRIEWKHHVHADGRADYVRAPEGATREVVELQRAAPRECVPGGHCERYARGLGGCIAGDCNPPSNAFIASACDQSGEVVALVPDTDGVPAIPPLTNPAAPRQAAPGSRGIEHRDDSAGVQGVPGG